MKHFKTLNNAEKYTSLPINGEKRAVYSLSLGCLNKGDIILACGEAEFTTRDTVYNIGVWSRLLLSKEYKGITGDEVTEANGKNITPDVHHDVHTKSGTIEVPEDGEYWLNFVSHCRSTSSNKDIVIEKDYGHLSVIVFPKTSEI